MAKLFLVKLKVYNPTNPNVRYRPGTANVLVAVPQKVKAIELAKQSIKSILDKTYSSNEADVKLMDCKPINFDHFINPKTPQSND